MDNLTTFKQFLQMDETIVEGLLLEIEKKKKKILKPKPRPKKILWFQDKNHWHNDLQFAHGGKYNYFSSQEEEEQARNIYAADARQQACYGMWNGAQNRGVTFHEPKPLHAVKHPRLLIKPLASGSNKQTNLRRK